MQFERRVRRVLGASFKIALASAVLAWMIWSGRVNPSRIAAGIAAWPVLLAMAAIFYAQIGLLAWRWSVLLQAQQVRLSFRNAFSLTMIGVLFTAVMPGSVGGDIVKAYYVARHAHAARPEALSTILVDRILGLLALLGVAAIAGLWNIRLVLNHRPLAALWSLTLALAVGGTLAIGIAFANSSRVMPILDRLPQQTLLARMLSKCIRALIEYKRNVRPLIGAVGASVTAQLLACVAFYLAARGLGYAQLSPRYFFFVVPLGLAATALPITPAGIGLGQAAFGTLFALVPGGTVNMGANTCSLFQFVSLLVYTTGMVNYLSYRQREPGESEEGSSERARGLGRL